MRKYDVFVERIIKNAVVSNEFLSCSKVHYRFNKKDGILKLKFTVKSKNENGKRTIKSKRNIVMANVISIDVEKTTGHKKSA